MLQLPPLTHERFPQPRPWPQTYCELCGGRASLRVGAWTIPTPEESDRRPQQTHWFCAAHERAAADMAALLWAAWPKRWRPREEGG